MLSDLKLVKETENIRFTQITMIARSLTLKKKILGEKMSYQSYNIKARVVYELKIKVKLNKLIK